MSGPIRPADIANAKRTQIPAEVFDAFNSEITRNFSNGRAIVYQNAVVDRLVNCGHSRCKIFDSGWLNIEEAYRAAGWDVGYDKPGYNELGDATFEFRATSR